MGTLTCIIYIEDGKWIYPLLFFMVSIFIIAGVTTAGAALGIKSIITGLKEVMEAGFQIYEEINKKKTENSRESNIKVTINMVVLPAIKAASMTKFGGKMVYGIIKKIVEKFETELLKKIKNEDSEFFKKNEHIKLKVVLEYGFKILGNVTSALIIFLQISAVILCSMGIISIITLSLIRIFFNF